MLPEKAMLLGRWGYRVVVGWLGVLAGAALPVGLAWWVNQRSAARWAASRGGEFYCPAALPVTAQLVAIALVIVVAAKLLWRCVRPGDAPLRDGWRAGWSVWRWLRFLTILIGGVATYRENYPHAALGQADSAVLWGLFAVGLFHFALIVPFAVMLETARSTREFYSAYLRIWLGRINRPAVKVLASDLASSHSSVRLAATRLLGERPASQAGSAALRAAAADEAPNVREEAVEALARKPEHDGLATLVAALRDRDEDVRHAAANGLRGWRSEAAREALFAATADPDERAREAATYAVSWEVGPRSAAWLAAAAADPSAMVRRRAFGSFRWREDLDPGALSAGLSDVDEAVRQYAAEGAARSAQADPATYDRLLPLLDDPCEEVRSAVLSGLAKHGRGRAVPVLLGLLDGSARHKPGQVLRALGETGDSAAVQPLCRLLQANSADDREAADACCHALGELEDPTAIEPLLDHMLRHPNADASAARAIASIGGPVAVDALCHAFDAAPASRDGAVFGLLWMQDAAVETALRTRRKLIPSGYRERVSSVLKMYAQQREAAERQLSRAPVPTGVNETSLSLASPRSCEE